MACKGLTELDRVDWDRKANPCTGSRRRINSRVHANQIPARVKQRASTVARVNCRINLNHVGDWTSDR
jgi:hypothetical protein